MWGHRGLVSVLRAAEVYKKDGDEIYLGEGNLGMTKGCNTVSQVLSRRDWTIGVKSVIRTRNRVPTR